MEDIVRVHRRRARLLVPEDEVDPLVQVLRDVGGLEGGLVEVSGEGRGVRGEG